MITTITAEAFKRDQESADFAELARMLDRRSPLSILCLLAEAVNEKSQLENDAYEQAAQHIENCADLCRLDYDAEPANQRLDESDERHADPRRGQAAELNRRIT